MLSSLVFRLGIRLSVTFFVGNINSCVNDKVICVFSEGQFNMVIHTVYLCTRDWSDTIFFAFYGRFHPFGSPYRHLISYFFSHWKCSQFLWVLSFLLMAKAGYQYFSWCLSMLLFLYLSLMVLVVLLYCYDIIYCFKLISLSILFGVFVMLNGEFLTGQGVSRICNCNIWYFCAYFWLAWWYFL